MYQVIIFDWEGTLSDCDHLLPGAFTCVSALHKAGYRLAVATNKSARSLAHDLKHTGLEGFFEITRSADQTFPKPHPQMLEEILVYFQVPPTAAVMIGDSESDMIMAQTVHMEAIGLDMQAEGGLSLRRAGAKRIFQDHILLRDYLLEVGRET